jgi:hypothetical protein
VSCSCGAVVVVAMEGATLACVLVQTTWWKGKGSIKW